MIIAFDTLETDPKSERWNEFTDDELKNGIKYLAVEHKGCQSTSPCDVRLLARLSPDSLQTVLAAAGRKFCIAVLCEVCPCRAAECAGHP